MNKWPDEMVDIIMDDISIPSSIHFFLSLSLPLFSWAVCTLYVFNLYFEHFFLSSEKKKKMNEKNNIKSEKSREKTEYVHCVNEKVEKLQNILNGY